MNKSLRYGYQGIDLLIDGEFVGRFTYPIGEQGSIEDKSTKKAALAWVMPGMG